MSRLLLPVAVAIAALAPGSPAQAAAPPAPAVFSVPQVLAAGGQDAVVAMGAGGDAVVAWSGVRGGVFVARRAAAGGPFSAPVEVAGEQAVAWSLRLARNDRGDVALAWTRTTPVPGGFASAGLRLAVAPVGSSGFGAVEDVPMAERDPVVEENIVGGLGLSSGPHLALAADGTALVAYRDSDRAADSDRIVAAIRPPGGPLGAAQVLGRRAIGPPAVAADGLGRLHVLWAATLPGAAANAGRVAYVAEALPGSGFGPPQGLSDPRLDASNNAAVPQLAANRAGTVVAMWNGGRPGELFPSRVDFALREPGGRWAPPQQLSTAGGMVMRATVALNDRGDAVIAWANSPLVTSAFRPAGAPFGAAVSGWASPGGSIEEMPMAIDALGVTLIVRRVDAQGQERIAAVLRRRDAAPSPEVAVSARGTVVSQPAVATDPFGNGLVVWTAPGAGGGAVLASAYSALAPAVAQLRVGSREFRLRVTEPARVRITVRRGASTRGRSASQTAVVRAGASKVAFAAAVRRLLKRRGRYTAVIRTRDAGPQAGTVRIRFRRR